MIKLRDLLTEIGETTDTYRYFPEKLSRVRNDDPTFFRSFNRFEAEDGESYTVTIEAYGDEDEDEGVWEWLPTIDVAFTARSTGFGAKGDKLSRQTFKVMATVAKIIKDFIEEHEWVKSFKFDVSDPNKNDTVAKTKLYIAFIKKQMPGAKIEKLGGYYKVRVR